ncbi:chaplin [Streptomyces sp. TRM68367]|uniref:chaplin n=1 Tax=Streptomyces sp. TRM68367 TaxID=2758415 RepID=UPI00165C36CF|nr:chaplin [Streptomyces sp. TRM68367]MBC9725842.1 DUF320 domain-containing protein [Streptomyces sp. TRM68367]
MRHVTRKGLMTVAAATGLIAAAGSSAHADSGASGSSSDSPGVLSGNTVQAPVDAKVNVCGNTVNVVGVLNPSVGNACANLGGGSSSGGHGDSGGNGGSHADGHASDSPGVGSGNHVQAPIHVPVNICGNGVDVAGAGSTTTGNDCGNGGGGHSATPPGGGHETPPGNPGDPSDPNDPGNPGSGGPGGPGGPENPVEPSRPGTPGAHTPGDPAHPNQPGALSVAQPDGTTQLARTGGDLPLGVVLPVGAAALLAGTVLYRKARASA